VISALVMENICLAYEGCKNLVLDGFSMQIEKGKIACLLGESGGGKTTVLRAIAGFEPVEHGAIYIEGRCVSSREMTTPPERRGVGMVFQDYALFPHLNAAQNIAFGLRKRSKNDQRARIRQLLQLVGLEALENHYPHELSGGQQQRIALARALAPEPSILLLDEPLSSLDGNSRNRLGRDLRSILTTTGQTALLVTHSLSEAQLMADDIGSIRSGKFFPGCDAKSA